MVHNVDYGDVSTVVHKSLEVIGAVAGPTALGIAANAANVIYHGVEVGFDVGIGSREGANEAAIDLATAGISKLGKIAKTAVSVGKTIAKKTQENQSDGDVHGNDKRSTKPQHGYEMKDKDGNVLEYGISGQPLKKDGTSPRIDQKIKTKYPNNPDVKGNVLTKNIPNRQEALDWEKGKVNDYKSKNNKRPPEQKRPL